MAAPLASHVTRSKAGANQQFHPALLTQFLLSVLAAMTSQIIRVLIAVAGEFELEQGAFGLLP